MKTKAFLIPFVAVLAVLMVGIVSAQQTSINGFADIQSVTFNDVELKSGSTNMAAFSGEVVPVRVTFNANADAEDVKIRVEIYSGRQEISATTTRFNTVSGNTYTKLLSLQLPADLKEQTEDLTLYVRVYDANNDNTDTEETYVVNMQRESYEFKILSVDYNSEVSSGEVFPVSVVVKNQGFQRMDDGYVIVSIPELGISSRGYFGDLIATENCSDNCDNEEDSMQKVVYLKIPSNAKKGVYELQVMARNSDSSTTTTKLISVGGQTSTQVIAAVKNQDIKAGETAKYDLIIVNSGDDVKVFNIQTVSGTSLDVSAPSVVTVGPKSSTTVPITVKPADDAEVGTYTFSVDVDGEQVLFGANVTGKATTSSVVALTIVLVIIFVVLLIVLIVLLTRKDKPVEEVETSYY